MYKKQPAWAGLRAINARRLHSRPIRPPRGKAKYFGRARRVAPVPTDRRLIVGVERFFCDELMACIHGYVHGGRLPCDTLRALVSGVRALGLSRHVPSFCSSARFSRRLTPIPPRSTGKSVHPPRRRSARAKPLNFTSPPDICVCAKWPRRTAAAGLQDESGRMPPALPRATRQRVSHGQQNAYRRLPPGGNSGGGATR